MEPAHIIAQLHAAGCRLIPEGEQLRVKHPSARTDELRALIRQHKLAILALLRQEQAPISEANHHPSTSHGSPQVQESPRGPASAPGANGTSSPEAMPVGKVHGAPWQPPTRGARLRPTPAPHPEGHVDVHTPEEAADVQLELAYDRIVERFLEEHPEWKTSPDLVHRYDRRAKAHLLGFKPLTLRAFSQYVATCTVFRNAAERAHYAAFMQWLVDHRIPQLGHKAFRSAHAPDVLPGQLSLFD